MDDIMRSERTNERRAVELPNATLQLPQWQHSYSLTLIQITGGGSVC